MQMLNALLVTDCRILVGRAGPGLGRIFTAIPVHLVEVFSLGVVRLQFVITNRPSRRNAAVMTNLAKIFFPQTKQCCAVKFGVAANVIVRVRMQFLTVRVTPGFLRVVPGFEVNGARAPVVLLARYVITTLKQQNLLAGWRELVSQRAATRACADDDYVVMIVCGHNWLRLLTKLMEAVICESATEAGETLSKN